MAEKILTAVPYPVVYGAPSSVYDWGTVCMDHPTWLGGNEPTDRDYESAYAFAQAQACNHPDHFGVTLVHIVSATSVVTGTGTHHLAMCGADLGQWDDIPPCHPVGNYLWTGAPVWGAVTCGGCLARCGRNHTSE